MDVSTEQVGETLVVTASGRLDTATAPRFDAALQPMLDRPRRRILLDLTGVSYISSAGLRSILHLVKHCGAHSGRLLVCGAQPHVNEVMEISGFLSLLDVFPDRAAALGAEGSA